MPTKIMPRIWKSSIGKVDLSREHAWLRQHKHEYVGQWVVLDGDRLVGHGSDPLPFFKQAKAEGVKMPFMHFIRDESKPFCGTWL